jgi:pyruvate/2-oxoglutarate dehydrogenase complex dihydrolipoamide dehydrogenase (E3) component
MPIEEYDVIIIGAGQAGGPLSTTMAKAGRKTALIEKENVGGSCINEGCTPTKTMVASARVAHLARRAAGYGVNTGPITVDLARVRDRKRSIVEKFRGGNQGYIERTEGVDLLFGEGRFADSSTVEVALETGETRRLTADTILINTGTRPRIPTVEGLDTIPVLTNRTIMELDSVPEHLLILGGGYVGLEFGQMFRRFGSEVTIIQRNVQLLVREDEDVAEEVTRILREEGITVLLETTTLKAGQTTDGRVELTVRTPDGENTLTGSHVLAAAGRIPNTDMLDLEAAGIEPDARGFIPVDDRLETSVPGIYALGDVNGGPAFTHISYDDFRIMRANLLQGGKATRKGRMVPYTVYIDPQLGRIGLTAKEASTQNLTFCVAKMPMNHVARALETDETRGFMKALVDPATKQILGAAILSIEGGEVMSAIQMAMMGNVPFTVLRDGVFAHPTLAESFNNLFSALDNEKRRTCHYPNR